MGQPNQLSISGNARELLRVTRQRTSAELPMPEDLFGADPETNELWLTLRERLICVCGKAPSTFVLKRMRSQLEKYHCALKLSRKSSPDDFFPRIRDNIQTRFRRILSRLNQI